MGIVYKAHDSELGRSVALKFLPPYLAASTEAEKRFVREARAASRLDHQNIATIYEIGETEGGRLFIAMPFYDGETLKAKIARGPLPVEEAVDLVEVAVVEHLEFGLDALLLHLGEQRVDVGPDCPLEVVAVGYAAAEVDAPLPEGLATPRASMVASSWICERTPAPEVRYRDGMGMGISHRPSTERCVRRNCPSSCRWHCHSDGRLDTLDLSSCPNRDRT